MGSLRSHIRGIKEALSRIAVLPLLCLLVCVSATVARADRIHLKDGSTIQVDEAWENSSGVWYRREGVTQLIDRERVVRIERGAVEVKRTGKPDKPAAAAKDIAPAPAPILRTWIFLVGGARMQVDEATETSAGILYTSGKIAILLDRERVVRIEREQPAMKGEAAASGARGNYAWSTGRLELDGLIKRTGARYGVDPYLIFCVMEQESQFNSRAVSPKGARGLMQLMPGTARRFGVRNPHDPSQSIDGGTRYLKELMGMFGGRTELVLASYNAGEGAVMRYGHRVPPYAETRNYVRRIGSRYARAGVKTAEKSETVDQ
jgi:hypothetical protein